MILTNNPDIIVDRWYRSDQTVGELSCKSFRCITVELPDLNNIPDKSCIPEGDYEYYYRESPKNGPCFELRDVPNRTYIQIHVFNFVQQSQGCISVGSSLTYLDDDSTLDATSSGETLKKLFLCAPSSGVIRFKS
jgi:hypothetical protein